MRGVVMHAPGDVRVEDRPEPTILKPTDAIVRLSAGCRVMDSRQAVKILLRW
jgi:threonine dehydrogenase-like Zn-dependent dehydrogenase